MESPAKREFDRMLAAGAYGEPVQEAAPAAPPATPPVDDAPSPAKREFDRLLASGAYGPPVGEEARGQAIQLQAAMEGRGRVSAAKAVGKAVLKAAVPTGPAHRPELLTDPDVLEALYAAHERGVPGVPDPEQIRIDGKPLPERPGLMHKVAGFLKRRAKAGLLTGVVPAPFGTAASLAVESLLASAEEESTEADLTAALGPIAIPPGGRSIRTPTVASTAMDLIGTSGRLPAALIAPPAGEGRIEAAAKSLIPPSWANVEPHDMVKLYREHIRATGGDPDSGKHMAGAFLFGTLTDPLTFTGLGLGRKAGTLVAGEQGMKIGMKAMRAAGLEGGTLKAAGRSLMDEVLGVITRKGTLLESRSEVADTIAKVVEQHANPAAGAQAAGEFEALGRAWGEWGVRVGIPFTGIEREVVSAKRLAKAGEATGRAWRWAQTKGPEVRLSKGGDALPLLRHVARVFDPVAEVGLDAGWDGALQLYARNRALANVQDHELRKAVDRLVKVSAQAPKASKAAGEVLLRATTMDLAEMVGLPAGAKAAGGARISPHDAVREWTTTVLDMPHRAALERFRDGTLVPTITEGDKNLERVARNAYAVAMVRGVEEADPNAARVAATDAFGGYVEAALRRQGFAEDAAQAVAADLHPRVDVAIGNNIDDYRHLLRTIPDRVDALVGHYKATTDAMLGIERARMGKYAAQAARAAAREAARKGGDAAKAAEAAHARVMDKAAGELESYVHHYIGNTKAVRRRGPILPPGVSATGRPAKERAFGSLVENWEHGQDPATDAMVSLAARTFASHRMRARWDAIDTVFGDRRFVRPVKESKGLTVAAGWDEVDHPVTGEVFAIRREAREMLERAFAIYDPSMESKAFRAWTALHARWKSYATHGRPLFYNLRNFVEDAWRMGMAGWDFDPRTMWQAATIGMLGRLEVGAPVKAVARRVRGPARSAWQAAYRKNKDRVADAWDGHLQQVAQKRLTTRDGRSETLIGLYRHAARTGVVDKGYIAFDVVDDVPASLENASLWDERGGIVGQMLNPFDRENPLFGQNGFYLRATGTTARALENHRRLTLFVDRWKRGDTFEEAARHVRKWLFDYDEVTEAERRLLVAGMPFYKFLRKNLPRQIEGMVRRPGRYAAVARGKRVVEAKAEAEGGPLGFVSDYVDDLYAWRLPNSWTGTASAVYYSPGLAFTDVNVLDPSSEGDLWDRFTPMLDLGAILAEPIKGEGRDPRTGELLSGMWREAPPGLKQALMAADAARRASGREPKWLMAETGPTGHEIAVAPAWVVLAWEKMFPHFVAAGKYVGYERADPDEAERAPFTELREKTGQSFYVQPPVRVERQEMRRMVEEGGLRGPAKRKLGVGRRPYGEPR